MPNDLQLKDVNDLIMSGLTKSEVTRYYKYQYLFKIKCLDQIKRL